MTRFEHKVAFVTGAASGIGKAIATLISSEGGTVVIADLHGTEAAQVAEQLDGSAIGIGTDVTDRSSVQAAIDQCIDRLGRIDVLVNDAGWDKGQPFLDSQPPDWQRAIDVNLVGMLTTCHLALPHMIESGGGRIVNLGSDAGRVGSSGEAVYSAAKGGVIAFTKTLAREMARHGICVNCVSPGPTDTALFDAVVEGNPKLREALTKAIPLRRLAQPIDIARAVAFLASDEAAYITGQTLSVSGGLSMS